jgi:hypothetical protein
MSGLNHGNCRRGDGRVERTRCAVVSEQGDAAFAVVDVDTLWRQRGSNEPFRGKGRACKIYTKVGARWLFLCQTGLLDYHRDVGPPYKGLKPTASTRNGEVSGRAARRHSGR